MSEFDNSALTEVQTPRSEDALQFELKGNTIGWYPSGLALQRAKDRGIELEDILDGIFQLQRVTEKVDNLDEDEEIDEELVSELIQAQTSDVLITIAKLVWVGGLHFEPNFSLEAVLSLLELEDLEDLPMELMMQKILPEVDEASDSGK
ncbi:hypothetical protein OSG_eHP25_00015 [environmental Halophage eHP-25]|nr:hypothetical protein OSG_eHP25_00015 [environmental Halophage eHP-25]